MARSDIWHFTRLEHARTTSWRATLRKARGDRVASRDDEQACIVKTRVLSWLNARENARQTAPTIATATMSKAHFHEAAAAMTVRSREVDDATETTTTATTTMDTVEMAAHVTGIRNVR